MYYVYRYNIAGDKVTQKGRVRSLIYTYKKEKKNLSEKDSL